MGCSLNLENVSIFVPVSFAVRTQPQSPTAVAALSARPCAQFAEKFSPAFVTKFSTLWYAFEAIS